MRATLDIDDELLTKANALTHRALLDAADDTE